MKIFFKISTLLLTSVSTAVYAANMAYVEVNTNRFENVGCYLNSKQAPYFQIASIFAANINGTGPNKPFIYLNKQVQATLNSCQIRHLHQKKIKVIVTLLGNHQNAGWSCMTDASAAKRFADEVVKFVEKYDLDGIDIDDEYSNCQNNNYSLIMMAQAIKTHPRFKNKLLTKALFADQSIFQSNYQGHRLSEYLDYGWEMTYSSGDFLGRLSTYIDAGMSFSNLMISGWTKLSHPRPDAIGQFSSSYKLAGVMVYDVKNNSQSYLASIENGMNHGEVKVVPNCLQ